MTRDQGYEQRAASIKSKKRKRRKGKRRIRMRNQRVRIEIVGPTKLFQTPQHGRSYQIKINFDSLFLGEVVLNKVAHNNKSSQLFLFLTIGLILLTSGIPCIGITSAASSLAMT